MAKKHGYPMNPVPGHFDYEPSFDPTDHAENPHGGLRGRETAHGLDERNGQPEPTHTRGDGFRMGGMHSNRTRCNYDGPEAQRQIREATVEDGVTFKERLRTDLDEDVFQW
jgi:hypothetical protein